APEGRRVIDAKCLGRGGQGARTRNRQDELQIVPVVHRTQNSLGPACSHASTDGENPNSIAPWQTTAWRRSRRRGNRTEVDNEALLHPGHLLAFAPHHRARGGHRPGPGTRRHREEAARYSER